VAGDFQTDSSQPEAQMLTEKAIYDAILNLIQTAKASEQIDQAMFYLSERKIIKSLIAAHERGVKVRILLVPNKDASGREKNGIPNRQVASELHEAGINVR